MTSFAISSLFHRSFVVAVFWLAVTCLLLQLAAADDSATNTSEVTSQVEQGAQAAAVDLVTAAAAASESEAVTETAVEPENSAAEAKPGIQQVEPASPTTDGASVLTSTATVVLSVLSVALWRLF